MEFREFRLKGKNSQSNSKKGLTIEDNLEITNLTSYRNMVCKNGNMVSIKKEKGKIKVFSIVFDSVLNDGKTFMWVSENQSLTSEEIEEIINKIELYMGDVANEENRIENIKNIATLNQMQSLYCENVDNSVFSVNTDLQSFFKVANEYFEEMGDSVERQQLTYVDMGEIELTEGMNSIVNIGKRDNTYFIKSDENDIKVIEKAEDEEGFVIVDYGKNSKFYEAYQTLSDKKNSRYEKAIYSFFINCKENGIKSTNKIEEEKSSESEEDKKVENTIINGDIFSVDKITISTDILLNNSELLKNSKECFDLFNYQLENAKACKVVLSRNIDKNNNLEKNMEQVIANRNERYREYIQNKEAMDMLKDNGYNGGR